MRSLIFAIVLLMFAHLSIAQSTDDYLKQTISYSEAVSKAIANGKYHHNVVRINTNEKKWRGQEGYSEDVNYYFEMDAKGITLRKILVTTNAGKDKAFKNFLFNDKGEVMLCYIDYVHNNNVIPQQSSFFINQELLAFSNSETMTLGNDMTDEIVERASKMYVDALKYRKYFQGMMLIQLN